MKKVVQSCRAQIKLAEVRQCTCVCISILSLSRHLAVTLIAIRAIKLAELSHLLSWSAILGVLCSNISVTSPLLMSHEASQRAEDRGRHLYIQQVETFGARSDLLPQLRLRSACRCGTASAQTLLLERPLTTCHAFRRCRHPLQCRAAHEAQALGNMR